MSELFEKWLYHTSNGWKSESNIDHFKGKILFCSEFATYFFYRNGSKKNILISQQIFKQLKTLQEISEGAADFN